MSPLQWSTHSFASLALLLLSFGYFCDSASSRGDTASLLPREDGRGIHGEDETSFAGRNIQNEDEESVETEVLEPREGRKRPYVPLNSLTFMTANSHVSTIDWSSTDPSQIRQYIAGSKLAGVPQRSTTRPASQNKLTTSTLPPFPLIHKSTTKRSTPSTKIPFLLTTKRPTLPTTVKNASSTSGPFTTPRTPTTPTTMRPTASAVTSSTVSKMPTASTTRRLVSITGRPVELATGPIPSTSSLITWKPSSLAISDTSAVTATSSIITWRPSSLANTNTYAVTTEGTSDNPITSTTELTTIESTFFTQWLTDNGNSPTTGFTPTGEKTPPPPTELPPPLDSIKPPLLSTWRPTFRPIPDYVEVTSQPPTQSMLSSTTELPVNKLNSNALNENSPVFNSNINYPTSSPAVQESHSPTGTSTALLVQNTTIPNYVKVTTQASTTQSTSTTTQVPVNQVNPSAATEKSPFLSWNINFYSTSGPVVLESYSPKVRTTTSSAPLLRITRTSTISPQVVTSQPGQKPSNAGQTPAHQNNFNSHSMEGQGIKPVKHTRPPSEQNYETEHEPLSPWQYLDSSPQPTDSYTTRPQPVVTNNFISDNDQKLIHEALNRFQTHFSSATDTSTTWQEHIQDTDLPQIPTIEEPGAIGLAPQQPLWTTTQQLDDNKTSSIFHDDMVWYFDSSNEYNPNVSWITNPRPQVPHNFPLSTEVKPRDPATTPDPALFEIISGSSGEHPEKLSYNTDQSHFTSKPTQGPTHSTSKQDLFTISNDKSHPTRASILRPLVSPEVQVDTHAELFKVSQPEVVPVSSLAAPLPTVDGNNDYDFDYAVYEDDLSHEVFTDRLSNHSASGGYGNTNNAGASSDENPHVLVNVWSIVDGQLQKTGAQRVPASAFVEAGLPNKSIATPVASTISPTASSLSAPSFPSSISPLSFSSTSIQPPSSLALTQTLEGRPTAGRPQNNEFTGTHLGGSGNSQSPSHILSPLGASQAQFQSIGELLQPVSSSLTGSYLQQQISNQNSGESTSHMGHQISVLGHQNGAQSHEQFPAFTNQELQSHQRNYSVSQASQGSKIPIPNYQQTSIKLQESPVSHNPDSQHQEQTEISVGSNLPQPFDNFDDYVTLLQILGANVHPSGSNSSVHSWQALLASLQNETSTEPLSQSANHNMFPNKTRIPELPINIDDNSEVFQSHSNPKPVQQNQPTQLLNRLHGNLETYQPSQTHSRPPASSSQSGLSYHPSYSIPNPISEQYSDLFTHKTDHPSSQRQHLQHSFQLHSQNSPYPQGNQHPSYSLPDVSNPQMPPIYEQMVLKDTQPAAGDQTIWTPTGTADRFSELHPQPGQVKPTFSTFSNLISTLSQHLPETDLQSDEYAHITAPSILANLPFLSDAPSTGEMQHVLENLHTLRGQTKTSTEPSGLPWRADTASQSTVKSPVGHSSSGLWSDSQTTNLQGSSLLPSAYVHGLPPVKDNNRANLRHPQVHNSNVSSINNLNLLAFTSSPTSLKINTSDLNDTYALTALQLIHNSTIVSSPQKVSSLSTSPSSTHTKLPNQQPPALKPFSSFSYQPPLGANGPTHPWPLGTREQNVNFGQASYQPSIPPPVFLKYPQQTTTSVPRISTVSSVPFGGVGNPGLLGVPIGLQENSHSFIAPTHQPTKAPASQVFGGVGNDALKGYPVHISGNFENSENEGFVSLSNHNPLINSPPPPDGSSSFYPATSSADLSLTQLQELQALNAIFAGAGESPADEAMKIVALQSLLAKNPQMLEHLFLKPNDFNSRQGQPLNPEPISPSADSVDDGGHTNDFERTHHNIGFKTEADNKGSGQDTITPRPAFQSGTPISILPGSPSHTTSNSDEENINLSELPPEQLLYLMQEFGRLPPTLQGLEEALSEHPRVPVTPKEPSHVLHAAQTTAKPFGISDGTRRESQGQDGSHISSDAKNEPTATENGFLSNRYVQACLQNKWCALGLSMTVAVGATGAMAAPLVVPVLGRKRRDVGDNSQNIFQATPLFAREVNLYAALIKEPFMKSSYDEQVKHNQENVTHEPQDSTANRTNSNDMLDFYDLISSPSAKLEEKQTQTGLATGFLPVEHDDESSEASNLNQENQRKSNCTFCTDEHVTGRIRKEREKIFEDIFASVVMFFIPHVRWSERLYHVTLRDIMLKRSLIFLITVYI
ncbi:mucin-2-like [Penaeus vannamei]|uniref:mucin-2-like n=1 Tax=Penaeus vannamei TaxID=6689 RepID=UPI00387F6BF3